MKTNKEIRKNARNTIKHNYFTLMFVSLVFMVIAGSYTTTFNGLRNLFSISFDSTTHRVYIDFEYIDDSEYNITNEILKLIFRTDDVNSLSVGENVAGGIFRVIFNGITQAEQFIFKTVQYILDVFVSHTRTLFVVILVLLVQSLYSVFVSKPLKVCRTRIYMESRLYYKTPFKRFIDIISKKHYLNVVKTILLTDIYQLLWNFTIVGGVIKSYSYRFVPMIMAENPTIKPKEAIKLSIQMSKGKKIRLFKLDFSFVIYQILDIATAGIFGVLFSNPYYTASVVEFYTEVKKEYKENKKYNSNLLNDEFLLKNPDNYECYPGVKKKERKKADEIFNYYQKYSITSLILMFFIFSFFGWLLEVGIYLFKDGVFVNRGTMQGPMLPIYGFGCIIVLFLLFLPKKFKKITDNPVITFFIIMAICGVIEYGTSVYLEYTHGMRWWDYTGYFLNINGRVCCEGLIFFGIGGSLALYVVAPFAQSVISKIPKKAREALCVVLVMLYLVDLAYSSIYPNVGAGITDDASRNQVIETQEN